MYFFLYMGFCVKFILLTILSFFSSLQSFGAGYENENHENSSFLSSDNSKTNKNTYGVQRGSRSKPSSSPAIKRKKSRKRKEKAEKIKEIFGPDSLIDFLRSREFPDDVKMDAYRFIKTPELRYTAYRKKLNLFALGILIASGSYHDESDALQDVEDFHTESFFQLKQEGFSDVFSVLAARKNYNFQLIKALKGVLPEQDILHLVYRIPKDFPVDSDLIRNIQKLYALNLYIMDINYYILHHRYLLPQVIFLLRNDVKREFIRALLKDPKVNVELLLSLYKGGVSGELVHTVFSWTNNWKHIEIFVLMYNNLNFSLQSIHNLIQIGEENIEESFFTIASYMSFGIPVNIAYEMMGNLSDQIPKILKQIKSYKEVGLTPNDFAKEVVEGRYAPRKLKELVDQHGKVVAVEGYDYWTGEEVD